MEHLDAHRDENDITPRLLRGYRFSVCETSDAAREALEVRRRVYNEGAGYDVPVPDFYDARSWLLQAQDEETGRVVGTMRLTPRFAGPFELEECFTLPKALRAPRAVELNRFAILPEYRKGKTFLPVVSLGLFKLAFHILAAIDAPHMVIASKPERIWTYEWLGFKRTGRTAQYGALDSSQHELLSIEVAKAAEGLAANPFKDFFMELDCPELVLPRRLPSLGLGVEHDFRKTA